MTVTTLRAFCRACRQSIKTGTGKVNECGNIRFGDGKATFATDRVIFILYTHPDQEPFSVPLDQLLGMAKALPNVGSDVVIHPCKRTEAGCNLAAECNMGRTPIYGYRRNGSDDGMPETERVEEAVRSLTSEFRPVHIPQHVQLGYVHSVLAFAKSAYGLHTDVEFQHHKMGVHIAVRESVRTDPEKPPDAEFFIAEVRR